MELSNNFITVDTVIDPITIDDFRILMDVRSTIINTLTGLFPALSLVNLSKTKFTKMFDSSISISKIELFYEWLQSSEWENNNFQNFINWVEEIDINFFDEHILPDIKPKHLKLTKLEKAFIKENIKILSMCKKMSSDDKKRMKKKMEIEIIRKRIISITAEHFLRIYELRPYPVKWNTEPPIEWLFGQSEYYDEYFNSDENSVYYIDDPNEFDIRLLLEMKSIHRIQNDHIGMIYKNNKKNSG